MRTIILLAALLSFSGAQQANAQSRAFEVETDPTAFFSGGYNFNFGYAIPHWAIRLVPYKTELPEFLHGNEGYTQRLIGMAFDLDYFLNANNVGLFAGPVVIYSRDEIESKTKLTATADQLLTGLRLGYRVMPFRKQAGLLRGLYFTPFVSPLYTVAEDVAFPGEGTFGYKPVQFWGGVHFGYRINH